MFCTLFVREISFWRTIGFRPFTNEHAKPAGYWKKLDNQRKFLEDVASNLMIKEDWYNVGVKEIKSNGGSALLARYNNSLSKCLKAIFPEQDWKLWKFSNNSSSVWQNSEIRKEFLESLFKSLNFKTMEDWYQISERDIKNFGGHQLLLFYKESLIDLLRGEFPNYNWKIWKLKRVPSGYWRQMENQKKFFDELSKEVGIKNLDDWYKVSTLDVLEFGGAAMLLRYHKDSLFQALSEIYPNYKWRFWRFSEDSAKELWKDISNQVAPYTFAEDMKFKEWKDWYSILDIQIIEHGGGPLLEIYGGSMMRALISVYPEYNWKLYHFEQAQYYWSISKFTKHFWEDDINVMGALKWVMKKLGIIKSEDWSLVTSQQMVYLGFGGLLQKEGGFHKLLMKYFPNEKWEIILKPMNVTSKVQHRLFQFTKELFPANTDFLVDYLNPELLYEDTKKPMQLDVYIPSLRLAFEYQGEQHYDTNHIFSVEDLSKKDREKKEACKNNGITLIEVPYWWNGSKNSLVRMIQKQAPDLYSKTLLQEKS